MTNHQYDIELIVKAAIEPTVVFENQGYDAVLINDKAIEFFSLSEDAGYTLRHFCTRADLFNMKAATAVFNDLKYNDSILIDWPVRLGKVRWLSAYIELIQSSGNDYVVVVFRNNTLAKESLLKLDNMVVYREMLDQLLAYNTNVNVEEIPAIIDQSLKMVGNYFLCDRSYVFEYSEDLKFKSNINEWCAPGIEPYIEDLQNIPINSFPYLKKKLLKMELVCVDEINALPEEAIEEREEFAKEGIQSILLIPFSEGEKPIGFIGLDYVHMQKQWSESEVSNLKLLARTFANLLVRVRNERQIVDNKNMYQTLFEAANEGILIFKNNVCIDANNKALDELHCSLKQLLGKSLVELSATSQANEKSPAYANVYLTEAERGSPQNVEWRIKRFDTTEFEAELGLNSFQQGDNVLVIVIFRDVSEHKRTVSNLIDNQRLLRKEIDNIVHPLVDANEITLLDVFDVEQLQKMQDAFSFATGISSLITDINGEPITQMSFSNRICEKVRSTETGQQMCMKSGRELGERAKKVLRPVSSPCQSCGFIDAASPIIVDGKHIGNWLIGQVRPNDLDVKHLLEYTRSLNLDDEGIIDDFKEMVQVAPDNFKKILNLLNVLTIELSALGYKNLKLAKAVSEHLDMEKELRQSKQEAEESDRLKSAFLANLSHEIRTPMNGIVGFSELLQYDGLTPDDRREYVRLIHQSSSQLLNIINDIIDISKIESGQIDVHAGYLDLVSLGADLQAFFDDLAADKGIELKFESNELSEFEIYSDEVKLRQVLTNLISNAIKFTANGHVVFGYEVLKSSEIELFVQDSGIGIDTNDVEFIFDRFWQAKDSDVKKGGTGLGLAITKAYVELLGGHINVESQRDVGTRFSFVIPKELK
ncbi:PocR ligand-binding domain-containing protein [Carboxylicivirga sp. A043]|uniref:PocR ligand-binding domain-containing protein n=1 Tax=Carboxylicivirga litoralis TaxID=2816963 RepID=UPI0021CB9857|nr:PocR ligand-binding domain-containing protein [Carboxylicivirga sp. A043]MCU4156083.1 PocR ligand-binding domain-containing protein [Carboxylicivirga sp. A043]